MQSLHFFHLRHFHNDSRAPGVAGGCTRGGTTTSNSCSCTEKIKRITPPPCQQTTRTPSRNDTSIKFFLYSPSEFPSFWGETSTCDHSKTMSIKHDHEEFAYNAMKRHPWRTSNPCEAQIAFLPLSFNLWKRNGCDNRKMDPTMIRCEIELALNSTGIFPHIRHVVLLNDWKVINDRDVDYILEAIKPALIQVRMEGRSDCVISHGYTSNNEVFNSLRNPNDFDLPDNSKTGDQRIYSVHMVGSILERASHGHRIALFTNNTHSEIPNNPFIIAPYSNGKIHQGLRPCNISSSADLKMGDHDRCMLPEGVDSISRTLSQHTQEESNYTLCLRGDTLGSDRWINGIVAGTALIQVIASEDDWNWLPFPDLIPWKKIVITIWEDDFLKDPAGSIRKVIETTSEDRLLKLQELSRYYAADLDWMAHNSRVLENLIHDAMSVPCRAFDAKPKLETTQ